MQSIVGPYAEVEAAYRRERIAAEYGHGTRRHHPVRALGQAITHRQHRRAEAA
jgi:hypothetical protein